MRCWINFKVDVFLAPEEVDSRQPVLGFDRGAGARPVLDWQYPCPGLEVRPGDFASDRARCNSHLGMVADALVFSRVAACHYIKLVALFSKPDGRGHGGAAFAEGRDADVFLAMDLWRDRHWDIVRESHASQLAENFGQWGRRASSKFEVF